MNEEEFENYLKEEIRGMPFTFFDREKALTGAQKLVCLTEFSFILEREKRKYK